MLRHVSGLCVVNCRLYNLMAIHCKNVKKMKHVAVEEEEEEEAVKNEPLHF